MKKWTNKTVASLLSLSMIASVSPNVISAETHKNATEAVKGLSKAERGLIKKMEATPSFTIDPTLLKERGASVHVIVEFKEESVAGAIGSMKKLDRAQKEQIKKEQKVKIEREQKVFKEKLEKVFKGKKKDVPKMKHTYVNTFNGASLELSPLDLELLLQTGVVQRIWNDEEVQVPQPVKLETVEETKALPTPLPHIGVDKLHAEGLTGTGIKVGVLDTGIDYNHPDLKDTYKGGYDFVDNDSDPMEATPADWKKSGWPEFIGGSSYYTSHGTHVAGTIASNPRNTVDYAMTGVAPNVDLYGYRVLGPYGSGRTSGILGGIERSVTDGLDVINLSLGSQDNRSMTPMSVAINNVAILGVVPVVAAGNAGDGAATLGTPGTSPLAITVGASTVPTNVPTTTISFAGMNVEGKLLGSDYGADEETVLNKEYQMVDVGIANKEDFVGKDVNGKIALVARGALALNDKIMNAKANGAVAVIMYNNVEGEIPHFLAEVPNMIPAFKTSQANGQKIVEALKNDPTMTVSLGDLQANVEQGDTLAPFSSRGPVTDNYDIKPDVVAPGVSIFSTYPEFIYSKEEGIDYSKAYSSISGTSMATPHVAGVAALIKQKHPEYDVNDIKAVLMNTADELNGDYNVYEVGAGRVDAYEAVHADNLVQVLDKTNSLDKNGDLIQIEDITGSLAFGALYESDTTSTKTIPVQISNAGEIGETFEISVKFLNLTNQSGSSLDAAANGVTLDIPKSVTVDASGSVTVDATLNIPGGATRGTYQGYVYLTNKDNPEEQFQVPFAAKYLQKGFAYATTDRYAVSTDRQSYHPALYPFLSGILKLNSPMETIDVVVSDMETNQPLGYVTQLDARGAMPETEYYLFPFFIGLYTPIVSSTEVGKPTLLPEGEYKLSYVGTDANGDTYEVGQPLIIDNKKPVLTYDKGEEKGLYEVTKADLTVEKDDYGVDREAVWFHGKVYDETVERLAELGYKTDFYGYPMDQTANNVIVYQDSPFPVSRLLPSETGEFKFGVAWDELDDYATSIALYGFDYATAGNMDFDKFFIAKQDQIYNTITYSKKEVKLGDRFNATFKVENAKELTSVTFTPYIPEQYKVKPVIHPDFLKAVKKAGGTATLTDLSDDYLNEYRIDVKGASVSGDIPALVLESTVMSDNYHDVKDGFAPWNSFSYTTAANTEQQYLPTYTDGFELNSKSSQLELYLGGGEALVDNYAINYNELGARAWLVDSKGNKYDATVENYGMATFTNIPATLKEYTLYVDIPGHFLYTSPVTLGKDVNGYARGVSLTWYTDLIMAGDVNRDGKVDSLDEKQIRAAYGQGGMNVLEDLNKDGAVDDVDVEFVLKNMGMENPYTSSKK